MNIRLNKKGFTLIEVLGVVVVLVILFAMAFFAYSRYLASSRQKALMIAVNSMEDASLSALTDCYNGRNSEFCNKYQIPELGEEPQHILLSDLINSNYIDEIKNPYKDGSCDFINSYVNVSRKSNEKNDTSDISFTYQTCLKCGGVGSKARIAMAKKLLENSNNTDNFITSCTEIGTKTLEELK